MPYEIRISVKKLAEFLLQSGSLDNRFGGVDRASEGARIQMCIRDRYTVIGAWTAAALKMSGYCYTDFLPGLIANLFGQTVRNRGVCHICAYSFEFLLAEFGFLLGHNPFRYSKNGKTLARFIPLPDGFDHTVDVEMCIRDRF